MNILFLNYTERFFLVFLNIFLLFFLGGGFFHVFFPVFFCGWRILCLQYTFIIFLFVMGSLTHISIISCPINALWSWYKLVFIRFLYIALNAFHTFLPRFFYYPADLRNQKCTTYKDNWQTIITKALVMISVWYLILWGVFYDVMYAMEFQYVPIW
jgi:hypothetical protein